MQKMVMLTEEEWRRLPIKLAEAMHDESLQGYGYKVVARDTGEEIVDRLQDWFYGIVSTSLKKVLESDYDY